jgi:hypothetical protein
MSRYLDEQREKEFELDERKLCEVCFRDFDECRCEEDLEEIEDLL